MSSIKSVEPSTVSGSGQNLRLTLSGSEKVGENVDPESVDPMGLVCLVGVYNLNLDYFYLVPGFFW